MKTTKTWFVAMVCALGLGVAACNGGEEQSPEPSPTTESAGGEHVGDTHEALITRTQCENGGGRVVCGFGCLYLYCTGGNPDYQGLATYAN
jgi:hypothetical protein